MNTRETVATTPTRLLGVGLAVKVPKLITNLEVYIRISNY